ncbi:hypothetical protein [Candidatus Solirubrobacter pratensis]|uniref:hypothetical protein n=1 Tax=Candidatus Solirubrobacter pratensis TaxID=1298857 RepID=UPI00048741C9|nr:hypothetical protein [Candidatus Solirubrobacter pratensis]
MELVTILQQLWRLRLLVAIAAVLAVVLGGLTAYRPGLPPKSRQYSVGIASARALVDTPNSQVVDLGVKDDANAGVLPARAVLLANLLVSSPLKDEAAKRANVPADRLIAIADTPTDGAPVDNQLTTGASVKATDPQANVLTAHTDESLPLITVNTQAPDPQTAARLANAAMDVLESQLSSLLAGGNVPSDRQIVLKRLGTARAGNQQRGPSSAMAMAVTIILFLLQCGLLLATMAVLRAWRAASAAPQARPEWEEWEAFPIEDPRQLELPAAVDGDASEEPAPDVGPAPEVAGPRHGWAERRPAGPAAWDRPA